MQSLLDPARPLELGFDPRKELTVHAQPGIASDPGVWTVGSHEHPSRALPGSELTPTSQLGPGALRPLG